MQNIKKYTVMLSLAAIIMLGACSGRKNMSGNRSSIDSLNAVTADSIKISKPRQ